MKKKIIIIGGGIAGLSAGIYGQKQGFETEIYEKHLIAGGQCTGWDRKGCHIDNCIHWLTGTRKGTKLYQMWEEVGALGENVPVIQSDFFYTAEAGGDRITLWKDLEKTKAQMLALSPEDKDEINKFIEITRLAETMEMPTDKPMDQMNLIDNIKLMMSMADMGKVMKEVGKISLEDYGKRFKHPLLQKMMMDYMPKEYLAYAFIVSYATFTSGNGGIPAEGSVAMVQRMLDCYQKAGGKLYTHAEVKKVMVTGKKAEGILLEDGSQRKGDFIICACDTDYTFHQLLGMDYMDRKFKEAYRDREANPILSGFHVAFSVDGSMEELAGTLFFDCKEILAGRQKINRISVKNYNYDKAIVPDGKTVLQTQIMQSDEDYEYWKKLALDKESYQKEKIHIANQLLDRLETRFPSCKGKIHIIDIWTPVTYHRYLNSYHGAYMSFCTTKKSKYTSFRGDIKGLSNVMLAGQWLMPPGGLPGALVTGKFAVQRIKSA